LATPEFWDYDSADAWLKKGRAPHVERPTKDAWNTKLVRVAPDVLRLATKDQKGVYTDLISFRKGMDTEMDLALADNHVFRERMNRYVAIPRGVSVQGTALIGYGPLLNGGVECPVVLAERGVVEIDHLGEVPAPLNKPIPMQVWTKQYLTDYLKPVEQTLKLGAFKMVNNQCANCLPALRGSDARSWSVGELMHDPEHLFSHIVEQRYPGELFSRAIMNHMGGSGHTKLVTIDPTLTTIDVEGNGYSLPVVMSVFRRFIEHHITRSY